MMNREKNRTSMIPDRSHYSNIKSKSPFLEKGLFNLIILIFEAKFKESHHPTNLTSHYSQTLQHPFHNIPKEIKLPKHPTKN
jgi:hypothetical protein